MNNPISRVDPSGRQTGILRWIYTGDRNAPDPLYDQAVQAGGEWFYRHGPIRGAYGFVGAEDEVSEGLFLAGANLDQGKYLGVVGANKVPSGTRVGREWLYDSNGWHSSPITLIDSGGMHGTGTGVGGFITPDGNGAFVYKEFGPAFVGVGVDVDCDMTLSLIDWYSAWLSGHGYASK